MGRTCPHCGSSEIDDDAARGDSTCMSCGTVLEESTIVSDVTYQERAGGGSTLVGQFVSRDRTQPNTLSGVPGLLHQESREVTYMKGKKLIEGIASQLRINQHCIDTAYNFFKMCVSRNFTRGRVRSHVVAACLYMTCRLENTAHLLLDFSDVTQVNVFDLGRTLNFLARSLKINLPTTDPCLYILRFAVLLEFGEKEKEVVSLATRLVQRMKRDWIATGRRPTGLCGAALVLAARCYNFNRTIGDIVRVVHISETVVRKRLDEFGRTPSSELTIDEFATVDLEHCEDPPAFKESRRKAREQLKRREEEALKEIEPEVVPLEEEVEKALERKRREKFKKTPYAKMMSESLVKESPELRVADLVVRNEIVEMVFDAGEDRHRPSAGMSSCYAPTLESLGISDPMKPQPVASQRDGQLEESGDGELDLEGIDDDEIDTYILSKEEAEMKSRLWMKLNKEHLLEMERRQKERAEEEEREKDGSGKKKRKKSSGVVKKKEPIVAATVQEAMVKVIQEKKLSNKINYEILKEIEDSESYAVKQFYPTRSEIISLLAADVPTDQDPTSASSLGAAPGPSETEADDKKTIIKLSPRRPLSRSLNSTRFRTTAHPNRSLSTTRSVQNAVKEEKLPSEDGGSTPNQLIVDDVDIKKEDSRERTAISPQTESELVTAKPTTEVILVAERTDGGLRGQEIEAVENQEGKEQAQRDTSQVVRGRYSKAKPRLAAAEEKRKAKTLEKSSGAVINKRSVDGLRKSKIETVSVGNTIKDLDGANSSPKQGDSTVGVVPDRIKTVALEAIGVATKRAAVGEDATLASEKQSDIDLLRSSIIAEEDNVKKPETTGPPATRSRYVKARPNLRGAKQVITKSAVSAVHVETMHLLSEITGPGGPHSDASIADMETESKTASTSRLRTAITQKQVGSACSDMSAKSHINVVEPVQHIDFNNRQDVFILGNPKPPTVLPSVEKKVGARKRGATEISTNEDNKRLMGSGRRIRVTGVMGLAAMAALGRDSDASSPSVHIVNSSTGTTSKLSTADNSRTIASAEPSSKMLEAGVLRSDHRGNNDTARSGKTVTVVEEASVDVTPSSIVDVSGAEITNNPIPQKEQQSPSQTICIISDEDSTALTSGAKVATPAAAPKSVRSRYVKVRPNIGCASGKNQRSKPVS